MSIRKKGARRITVDGETYLWRVRHREPEPDNRGWSWAFAVQHADQPGSSLIVHLMRRHPSWDQSVDGVHPSEVSHCIREAIENGWQPSVPGSPFEWSSKIGHPSEEVS